MVKRSLPHRGSGHAGKVAPRRSRGDSQQRPEALLKWPGGKAAELGTIRSLLPERLDRWFEPFVGGGAVLLSVPATVPAFANDASTDLIDLYRLVQRQDADLFGLLDGVAVWWHALTALSETRGEAIVTAFRRHRDDEASLRARADEVVVSMAAELEGTVPALWGAPGGAFVELARRIVPDKLARMRRVERQRGRALPLVDARGNVEGALKATCYTLLRSAYNRSRLAGERSARQAALFFFLREFAYAAMFRFNGRGEFNVPYGGITYNRKAFEVKIDHLRSAAVMDRLDTTVLGCGDFEVFLRVHRPGPNDFVFLDPPYDSDFSAYDGRGFSLADHRRLAATMRALPCAFQLVIKSTPEVLDLYRDDRWEVLAFDKIYPWTIKERNDRAATHLVITNYPCAVGS